MNRRKRPIKSMIYLCVLALLLTALSMALFFLPYRFSYIAPQTAYAAERPFDVIQAYVTGYNLVPAQTDSTPCIGASGMNLCGRRDTVACPRAYALGTVVEIDGSMYSCEDRLDKKYDDRWDINCDQDVSCPDQVTGFKSIKIYK